MSLDENPLTMKKRKAFAKSLESPWQKFAKKYPKILEGVSVVFDLGSAHGQNVLMVTKYVPKAKIVLIDPKVGPTKSLFKNKEYTYLKERFEKADFSKWRGKKNIVLGLNFLQLFEYPNNQNKISNKEGVLDKGQVLDKMIELAGPGGLIIIVDEVYLRGIYGFITGPDDLKNHVYKLRGIYGFITGPEDLFLNKFYNLLARGPYKRQSLWEYTHLFKDKKLKILYQENYNRRTYFFALQVE